MYFVRRNDQLQYSEQEEENMLSKVETKKLYTIIVNVVMCVRAWMKSAPHTKSVYKVKRRRENVAANKKELFTSWDSEL